MILWDVIPWLLGIATMLAGTPTVFVETVFAETVAAETVTAETVPQCALRLLDDRGLDIEESVTICRDDRPDNCLEPGQNEATPLEVEVTTIYRVEGEGHGPAAARPRTADDGTCTITVARKASVEITFDADEVSDLKASFYRLDEDRDLRRAASRVAVGHATTVRVAAGPYVLSLVAQGWAPDLRVLHAAPGSAHSFRYRRLDGWSVVLRTIADSDDTPVGKAEIELWSLPGFDVSGHDDPRPRRLMRRQSDDDGLVVVSGLRVPVAAATVHHERFIDGRLSAFSSGIGTFRVFEARLHSGGHLEARVLLEGLPATAARCELAPPDLREGPPGGLRETLHETRADVLGVCRAAKIPAGRYALKVTLPDDAAAYTVPAYTVQPLVITDGEASAPTVELQPITVTGRVSRGNQGAPGYKVDFRRTAAFDFDVATYSVSRTTTDENGDYDLVVWASGNYVAEVLTESASATFRLVELEGDDTVDFQLAAKLEGQVIDASGTPLPDAAVTVRWPGSLRTVVLDDDARFRVSFREAGGVAELQAREIGFPPSKPVTVQIAPELTPEPVTLVLHRRDWRVGRVVLASGRPAIGAWVHVYRFAPGEYPRLIERVVADASGRIEIPSESGPVRLFHGGPGCPLGMLELAPTTDDIPFEIHCKQPGHILVRLISDDPGLRDRAPLLLRRGEMVLPPEVLQYHLHSLGLPSTTDGQGRLGLVALEPGFYEIFHGKGTSVLNMAAGHDAAFLASVSLGVGETVEVEVTVDFRRQQMDARRFLKNE